MSLYIIRILSAVLILLSISKLVILLVKPTLWFDFVKLIYKKPKQITIVTYALAIFTLCLLLISGLSVIQILAVCLFMTFVIMAGIIPYSDALLRWVELMDMKVMLKQQRIYIAFWVLLLMLGVYQLFTR